MVLKQYFLVLDFVWSRSHVFQSCALQNDNTLDNLFEVVPQCAFLVLNEVAFDQQPACVQLVGICCPKENQHQVQVKYHLLLNIPLTIVTRKCLRRVSLYLISQTQEILIVFVVKVLRRQKQRTKIYKKAVDLKNRSH